MLKKIVLAGVVTIASTIGAVGHVSAFGLGDITRPILKGASDLDPFKPGSSTSPIRKYKVVIRNPNRTGVHYSFNGRPELLSGKRKTTWTVKNVSHTVPVSFDNGRNQTVSYDVGRGSYVFRWNNGVLDLYRD